MISEEIDDLFVCKSENELENMSQLDSLLPWRNKCL